MLHDVFLCPFQHSVCLKSFNCLFFNSKYPFLFIYSLKLQCLHVLPIASSVFFCRLLQVSSLTVMSLLQIHCHVILRSSSLEVNVKVSAQKEKTRPMDIKKVFLMFSFRFLVLSFFKNSISYFDL